MSRPLLVVAMLEGGGFRLDPVVWLGVLAAGAADRPVGVFDRVVGVPCCLEDLPLVGGCFARVAGELERVERGVGCRWEAFFLASTGRRDVGEVGDVGVRSARPCRDEPRSRCAVRGFVSLDPATSLWARV